MKETFVVSDHTERSWRAEHISCPVCREDKYRELFKLVKSRCKPKRPADSFVKCTNCGFIYISPRILFPVDPIKILELSKSELDIAMDNRVSDYELLEDLERIRKFKPEGNLLEIGCATGAFLNLANDSGYQTTGIEPTSERVAYARKRYGLNVICGAVGDENQDINLKTESFDVVVMIAVIEHVLNVRETVQFVHKCLCPGGILYLTTPDVNSVRARVFGQHWSMYHICGHHHFFCEQTLRHLLKDQGFHFLEKWGTYRGSKSPLKRIIKKFLSIVGISYDVISITAKKVK